MYDAHHHRLHPTGPGCLTATDPTSFDDVLAQRERQHIALGLHPWWCTHPQQLSVIDALPFERLDAVGEFGLDRLRGDEAVQVAATEHQLRLATEHVLPVVLHCVRAHTRLGELLADWTGTGLVHAWTGSKEQLPPFLKAGLHISFGPALLRSTKIQRALRHVPLDRLLFESDAADGAGPLEDLAQHASKQLQRSDLATIVTANALRLFPRILS